MTIDKIKKRSFQSKYDWKSFLIVLIIFPVYWGNVTLEKCPQFLQQKLLKQQNNKQLDRNSFYVLFE